MSSNLQWKNLITLAIGVVAINILDRILYIPVLSKMFSAGSEPFAHQLFAAILLLVIAFAFLAPTILTISGSFFTQAELSTNYGMIFEGAGSGGSYVSEKTNLKFIPDQVSFKQYSTVLFLSPEYLFKFWNSVKYTLPIVIFQTVVACLAAYGFTRYRSKGRQLILFLYIIPVACL